MNSVLQIQGIDVRTLKEQYDTPLYIFDQTILETQCRTYKEHFVSESFDTKVLFASKAFSCVAMLKLASSFGLCVDAVSMGEIHTAIKAGVPADTIYFHGNNKTLQEIDFALEHGIRHFIVDNIQEVQVLKEKVKDTVHVMLRINPCIEAHTHEFIQTANIDSKFGINIYSFDEIVQLIRSVNDSEHLLFEGLHCHIGSQIFEKEAFIKEIETMFTFISRLEQQGIECPSLDLGGGFAVRYTDADSPIPVDEVCRVLIEHCESEQRKLGTHVKQLLIEPGRSIVAEAGMTLYTIGFTKETPHKHYLFVDGGMTDNIRPALYQAAYDADVATNMQDEKNHPVCVAGKCCESGDILIEKIDLQAYRPGDLLIVYSTGAYGFSMFNNYNRNLRPAVVFVKDGTSRLAVRRQTLDELIEGDVIE